MDLSNGQTHHHHHSSISTSYLPPQNPQTPTIVKVHKDGVIDNIKIFFIDEKDKDNELKKPQTPRATGSLIMLTILFTVFLMSVLGFIIMWFTEMYNDTLLANLVYKDNTTAIEWWKNPPLDPHLKVYIFNYTNADRYMNGLDSKLILEEIGPYVYIEKVEKMNITFNNNYTISYQEHRTYAFQPELSLGKQYDKIIIPNVPMLTAASKIRDRGFFVQFSVSSLLTTMDSKPFMTQSAHSFLWGYPDKLIEMSQQYFNTDAEGVRDGKFGMLSARNGTSKDVFTIFSGEDDIKKLGIIENFNGHPAGNHWGTDECNNVDGTDGSQFPPYLMDKKHSLEVFIKAFCRKFPLLYDSEVNLFDGIPAWRYKAPKNVFAHPDINPENQCYCDIETATCPPNGIFNASVCFAAPIVISFPHFFTGDESLFEHLEGLQPDEQKHLTFADVHPRLAFPIDGASRFQINIQVQKVDMISDMKNFHDNQILPVIWMEVVPGELSEELRAMIYHSTFSANAIQLYLRYGTLIISVITLMLLIATCCYRGRDKNNHKTIK